MTVYISNERFMEYNKRLWLVSSKPSGIYPVMAKKLFSQFFNMFSHYSSLHVIRFDLHQKHYNANNSRITQFLRRFIKQLKRRYNIVRIGYCWVREQEDSSAQHYHFVLFLAKRVVRHPKKVLQIASKIWSEMSGFFFVPKHCFYNVDVNDLTTIQKVIYRLSYFAKARGKGKRPHQTKNYSTSRLKAKTLIQK